MTERGAAATSYEVSGENAPGPADLLAAALAAAACHVQGQVVAVPLGGDPSADGDG